MNNFLTHFLYSELSFSDLKMARTEKSHKIRKKWLNYNLYLTSLGLIYCLAK